MKKTLTTFLFAILIVVNSSCQNKQENKMIQNQTSLPKFKWEENICSPIGYPMEVYRGGLEGNGAYVSLDQGTTTGEWGSSGSGTSYGIKALPNRINCIWVSYAEGCLYSIDSKIDYDKMLELFKEGYQDSGFFFNKNGEYKKQTYTTILTGFAPGGIVVIWVMGPGMQVEIGRYQGEKYQVPQEEIAQLDAHQSLLFSKSEYKRIMNNTKIVPLEVREANEGKPIPYGLWDSYRIRYTWKPIFKHEKEIEITSFFAKMLNGEYENCFDKSLLDNKFAKRGILKSAGITWTDWKEKSNTDKKGQGHKAKIIFDEQEIIEAYEDIFKENKEGQVEIRFCINYTGSFVTVQLTKGDKEVRLVKTKVKAYKTKNLSLRK